MKKKRKRYSVEFLRLETSFYERTKTMGSCQGIFNAEYRICWRERSKYNTMPITCISNNDILEKVCIRHFQSFKIVMHEYQYNRKHSFSFFFTALSLLLGHDVTKWHRYYSDIFGQSSFLFPLLRCCRFRLLVYFITFTCDIFIKILENMKYRSK